MIASWERGRVTTEHTIWCARGKGADLPFQTPSTVGDPYGCRTHHQSSERRITREARRDGWRLTREYGWLCPPCARAYEAWKAKA